MTIKGVGRQLIAWALLVITVIYLITGFAVTQFRIFTPISGGYLGKAVTQQLHEILWLPFIILLVLHVGPVIIRRYKVR